MFIWCNGRPYKVPNEKSVFITQENFDEWCNSDQATRINTWVQDTLYPPLGNDEFYPFTNEQDLIDSINSYTIRLENELTNWKNDIQNWLTEGFIS